MPDWAELTIRPKASDNYGKGQSTAHAEVWRKMELTVNLSEQAAQHAATLAALEGRDVGQYVATIVEEKLLQDPEQELKVLASLSDEDVLALADMHMTPEEDARMSELLDQNREGQLQPGEKRELDELMRVYTQGTLKKAMGLAEAVRRGLRPPLSP